MALSADGKIFGIEIDMLAGFGGLSIYLRGSVGEVIQTLQMVGAPYEIARLSRACPRRIPEQAADRRLSRRRPAARLYDHGAIGRSRRRGAAHRSGRVSPAQLSADRRLGPGKTLNGIVIADLSLDACLDRDADWRMRLTPNCANSNRSPPERAAFCRGIGLIDFHGNHRRRLGTVPL